MPRKKRPWQERQWPLLELSSFAQLWILAHVWTGGVSNDHGLSEICLSGLEVQDDRLKDEDVLEARFRLLAQPAAVLFEGQWSVPADGPG